jgi:hypothetical protein
MRTRSDMRERFTQLANVEDGWWGERSKAPSAACLKVVQEKAEAFDEVRWPAVFPTNDGGLELQWGVRGGTITVTYDADGTFFQGVLGSDVGSDVKEDCSDDEVKTWLYRLINHRMLQERSCSPPKN